MNAAGDAPAINLKWLIRLRFGSLAGQVGTILFVHLVMGIALPLLWLLGLVALSLLGNLLALLWQRRGGVVRPGLLTGLLIYDVLHLTALLYLSGGPFNPFSFLYLVLIALSTLILRERAVWALAALSALCSALLFLHHRPLELPSGGHAAHLNIHLYGMWVAFSVAACFIVYFLMRTRAALAAREEALAEARRTAAHKERLASLATLAAGAAHELATPLSTIALVVGELRRHLADGAPRGGPSLTEDIDLIEAEVMRCRAVLDQMAVDAGQSPGEGLVEASLEALLTAACEGLPRQPAVRREAAGGAVVLPLRALAQALRGLVKNAQSASPAGSEVLLRAALRGDALRIEVIDRGCGMSEAVLSRLGEPFFTTRAPGQGMGLGIFLCRAVVEGLGGALRFTSSPGRGTTASIGLPLSGPAAICRRAGQGAS